MPENRAVCESNIYHIVARGVGQQIIFETDNDRLYFLALLEKLLQSSNVQPSILAWCLMDNHFHLVIAARIQEISKLMQRLLSKYALYFNETYSRAGHLFQGRFRSEAVDTEQYLLTVVRYVHRNPVKAGFSNSCYYKWSSYKDYLRELGPVTVDVSVVTSILGSEKAVIDFHQTDSKEECLEYEAYRHRLDNKTALLAAHSLFGEQGAHGLRMLPRAERDRALRELISYGLTVRQAQRLTGISIATISRACSSQKNSCINK